LDEMRKDGNAHAAMTEPKATDENDSPRRPAELQFSEASAVPPLRWPAVRGPGAGLKNRDVTCFLNVVAQCLSYMPPLLVTVEAGPVSDASNPT
jgi:hypothetical protein